MQPSSKQRREPGRNNQNWSHKDEGNVIRVNIIGGNYKKMVRIGSDIFKGLYNVQLKKGETYEFEGQGAIAKKWYHFAINQLFYKCR